MRHPTVPVPPGPDHRGFGAELTCAVIGEPRWITRVDSTYVGVGVVVGAVTFSGGVVSFPARLLAGRAAPCVRGVRAAAREITVRSDRGAASDTDAAREAGTAVHRAVACVEGVGRVANTIELRPTGGASVGVKAALVRTGRHRGA